MTNEKLNGKMEKTAYTQHTYFHVNWQHARTTQPNQIYKIDWWIPQGLDSNWNWFAYRLMLPPSWILSSNWLNSANKNQISSNSCHWNIHIFFLQFFTFPFAPDYLKNLKKTNERAKTLNIKESWKKLKMKTHKKQLAPISKQRRRRRGKNDKKLFIRINVVQKIWSILQYLRKFKNKT